MKKEENDMADVQWYPGHMTKALRQMQQDLSIIDLVIELTDARAPLSGRNPDVEKLAKNKMRIVLLNKADLADPARTQAVLNRLSAAGVMAAAIDSRSPAGIKPVRPLVQSAVAAKQAKDQKKGIVFRPVRAMVAGIPNVGKSKFINSFAGKTAAKTGNRPGVTRGKQWIRIDKNVDLLDTPGILWPKFEDQEDGTRVALLGSVRDEVLDKGEMGLWLARYLCRSYPGILSERYGIEETEDPGAEILEEIGCARGCLLKGGQVDYGRASAILIDDFRSGKLGRITLEEL